MTRVNCMAHTAMFGAPNVAGALKAATKLVF